MQVIKIVSLLAFLSWMLPQQVQAQDRTNSTGFPGDNFSLQGALELFKNSKTLEEFEKKLNDKSNNVNNLDLNQDDKVDYVKVTDKVDNNIHAIVLRVNVNAKESQDIAVIAVEKTDEKTAVAQIIGDEDLYGKDVVVEPIGTDEQKVPSSKEKGPFAPEVKAVFVVVNVWYWPVVQYIYMPDYVIWNSPWYWGYYPPYWSPWPPYPWYYHYNHCRHYHNYHHVVYVHRVNHGPVYRSYRKSSPTVRTHYQTARNVRQPAAPTPVNRQPVNKAARPASRPVEGNQGVKNTRPNREIAPARQNPSVRPVERNVNRQPARQSNPQVNPPRQNPGRQVSPQPQRQQPQVTPQRQSPQMRSTPPPQRNHTPRPQGGGKR